MASGKKNKSETLKTPRRTLNRPLTGRGVAAAGGMLDAAAPIPHLMEYQADSFDGYADEIANYGARHEARKNSLREYLNSGYAKNAARVFGYHVVGKGGPQLYLTEECGLEKAEREALEWEFYFWQKKTRDVQKVRRAVRACMFAGETFQRFVFDPSVPDVMFNVAEIEAARVDCPWHDTDPNSFDGITYRGLFPQNYKILVKTINPDYYNGFDYEDVPASEMMLIANIEMPGQHRGLPIFTPVVRLMEETAIWEKYTLGAAAWAARWGGFVRTNVQMDASDLGDAPDAVIPGPNPGDLFFLEDGYTPEQIKAEYPTSTFDDFKSSLLNEIGAGVGMPKGMMAADTSNYNYSSWRGEKQNYWGFVDEWQDLVADELMNPRFGFWLRCFACCQRQTAEIARKLLNMWENNPDRIPHEWKNRLPDSADPEKDRKADEIALKLGLTSIHQICSRDGLDYDQLRRERKQESEEDFAEVYRSMYGGGIAAGGGDWSAILNGLQEDTTQMLTDGRSEQPEGEKEPSEPRPGLKLLNAHQAAEKFGISASSIRNWRNHGLNSYKIGGGPPMFDENELEEFIRNHNTTRGTPDGNEENAV